MQDFRGVVGRTVSESTPWWPEPIRAPEGSPNIVVIVLDDVGFADLGCYGSEIPRRTSMRSRERTSVHELPHHRDLLCRAARAS